MVQMGWIQRKFKQSIFVKTVEKFYIVIRLLNISITMKKFVSNMKGEFSNEY